MGNGRLLFAGDSNARGVARHLPTLMKRLQVETLVLPGCTVSQLASELRQKNLRSYELVVVHVGCCDLFSKSGRRRNFPKGLVQDLMSLYTELTGMVELNSTHILMSGLLPKVVPASDLQCRTAARHGISRYTATEYNRSARKTNKKLCAAMTAMNGFNLLPIEVREFWKKDNADEKMFSLDCVHLNDAGQKTLASSIAQGLGDLIIHNFFKK